MAVATISEWLQAGQVTGSAPIHRQLLVISGDRDLCHQRAALLLSSMPAHFSRCWIGDASQYCQDTLTVAGARKLLGQEFDVAVFDAHAPFRPGAFMALAGTIKQGGRLIVLAPEFSSWAASDSVLDAHFLSHGFSLSHSPYLQRLQAKLQSPSNANVIAHWHGDRLHLPLASAGITQDKAPAPFATPDQYEAFFTVNAFISHANHCAVLTAPRGRGKSALLGLLAAELITQGHCVELTSPVTHNTGALFKIAQRHSQGKLACKRSPLLTATEGRGHLQWHAPDSPSLTRTKHRYLFIDEAASLPLPVLRKLVHHADRLVLATTTHGYEGSGQGFLSRFLPALASTRPLTHQRLSTPVRWLPGDPLEAFVDDALLMNHTESQPGNVSTAASLNWHKTRFSALSESQFYAVIQLLITAHYQTTPDDIMRLVDAPDTFLVIGQNDAGIACVAIIAIEGGEKLSALSADISSGKRRVRGHLGAQRLALTAACAELAQLNYWRINRIAVAPPLQSQGIGGRCLEIIRELARTEKTDGLISSFGSTRKLLNFWQTNGFEQVAKGLRTDKASGERSALVLMPVSDRLVRFMMGLRRLFVYDSLQIPVSNLNAPHSTEDRFCRDVMLTRLKQFSSTLRSFDHLGAAWLYFKYSADNIELAHLADDVSLSAVAQHLGLKGKQAATLVLRAAVKNYLLALEVSRID